MSVALRVFVVWAAERLTPDRLKIVYEDACRICEGRLWEVLDCKHGMKPGSRIQSEADTIGDVCLTCRAAGRK